MQPSEPVFEIRRNFKAPRKLVFECWINPEHSCKWFCPPGASMKVVHCDARPGGYLHTHFTGEDGSSYYGKYTYLEIDPIDRIVYINAFADENAVEVRHPLADGWPLRLHTTVLFSDAADGTTDFYLKWVPMEATQPEIDLFGASLDGCAQGWGHTLALFEQYLEAQQ